VVLDARHHERLDRPGLRLWFAYGVGEHSDRHWGDRYGEGTLAGKRAMLVVTTGGWEEHYAPRGINGPINDILFPIQHGMLFYPGFEVLPPLVFYRTEKTDEQRFAQQCRELGQRLDTLAEPPPSRSVGKITATI
jgi:NAD(P)H dehydrogenase (quinone)